MMRRGPEAQIRRRKAAILHSPPRFHACTTSVAPGFAKQNLLKLANSLGCVLELTTPGSSLTRWMAGGAFGAGAD